MPRTAIDLPFLEIEQPVGKSYLCSVSAQKLLEICTFDFRQIEENNGVKMFLGIQRELDKKRVKDIRKYIATEDASFPTSIVISVDERCAELVDQDDQILLRLRSYEDPESIADSVPFRGIATIIDGQHRLAAFKDSEIDWTLSVNIFVGIDEGTRAMIFSKVNLAQTKVNRSLVYDLFGLDRDRSPEKTAHEITVLLNDLEESPFFERIKRLGSATDGVFGETLSQATVVKGILELLSKDPIVDRDIGRRSGIFPKRGADDFQRRIFYPFFADDRDVDILAILMNYFTAVREKWPDAWDYTGRGAVLSKTNGYNGLIRFLRDAYLHLTDKPTVISKENFAKILARSNLKNEDFTTDRFVPGTGGSSALYRELLETLK